MIYRTLSVMQPWPHAIFHLGKDVENRSWVLPPAMDEQTVLIHAGKKIDKIGLTFLEREGGHAIPDNLSLGGIVGFAVFSRRNGMKGGSPWAVRGLYNWSIVQAGPLPFHPCKGMLGFFAVDYPYPVTGIQP